MPFFIIILIVIFFSAGFAFFYYKKKNISFEKKGFSILVFALSLISLVISLKLFLNMGRYADEYGASPVLVSGGMFWLSMDWILQGLLFILCIITGLKLMSDLKKS